MRYLVSIRYLVIKYNGLDLHNIRTFLVISDALFIDIANLLDQCPVWVPIPSVWCADLYHVGTVCRGFHIACISACRICAFLRVYNELCVHS